MSSSPPKAASSAPKSSSDGRGIRTPTRSPTPCASPSRPCANALANRRSSPPSPVPATASTRNRTPRARESSVDRSPGLSVRLKLTLSYAGFLMLAGALMLAAVWVFLLRGYPARSLVPKLSNFPLAFDPHNFGPAAFGSAAVLVLAFLLVFGLVGGWFLAGRMLAPLDRITDATRIATTGALAHR